MTNREPKSAAIYLPNGDFESYAVGEKVYSSNEQEIHKK